VGRLLTRVFGALVLLILCVGLIEVAAVLAQHRVVQELTTRVAPLELANARLRGVLGDAQRGLRGYLLTGDGQLLDTYHGARGAYPLALREVRDLALGSDRDAIDAQARYADGWWAVAERQREAAPRSTAAGRYVAEAKPIFQAFVSANTDLDRALATRAAHLQRQSARLGTATALAVVALTAGVAGLAAASAVRTGRRITRPLRDVVTVLDRLERGEHDARADAGTGPAEIRAVAAAVNAEADANDRARDAEQRVVARLQELDTVKNDFMSTVSPELRTPLTSISGYVELLLDSAAGDLAGGQRRMLEVISRNTRRLRELIEDILLLSKIESGGFRTVKRPIELARIIDSAVEAIAPAAATASVGLHTEVHGDLPLSADPEQLDRVLMNLLSNAVKFTPADGTVTVTGRTDGDAVVVEVTDTGMGIPEAEQQALFARFFRASNAIRQAVPGTGLGLAIVATIVDNHAGHIEVRSVEKAGTTVTVRLPVH
jgi:signal transduction histidine kinase